MSNERIDKKLDNSVPFLSLFASLPLCSPKFMANWKGRETSDVKKGKEERRKKGKKNEVPYDER